MANFSNIVLFNFPIKIIKSFIILACLLIVSFSSLSDDNLDQARKLFIDGKYKNAMKEASKYDSAEAKILESRILSIYTHFNLKDKIAEENFLKSYEIAKSAIKIDPNNDNAYVEAAHSLGRYGQKIGIMAAITKGIADRVKRYLDKSLEINSNNILANLSKGIWHAEIINQAGKTVAKAVYGARVNSAIIHFEKVKSLQNSNEIGVLYELAYGYSLLNEDIYLKQAKILVEELIEIEPFSDMDKLYKNKGLLLLEVLP